MRERPSRSGLDAPGTEVMLPAEAVTMGRSHGDEAILVAHTGHAHLAMTLDRHVVRRLRQLEREATTGPVPPRMDDDGFEGRVDLPDVIPFRRATAHELAVVDGRIHLTLHATGDPARPDVHVEQRLDAALLRSIGGCVDDSGRWLVLPLVLAVALLVTSVVSVACVALSVR